MLPQAVDPCKDTVDVWRVWALASAAREHKCKKMYELKRHSMLEAGGLASLALGYGEAAGPPTLGRFRLAHALRPAVRPCPVARCQRVVSHVS